MIQPGRAARSCVALVGWSLWALLCALPYLFFLMLGSNSKRQRDQLYERLSAIGATHHARTHPPAPIVAPRQAEPVRPPPVRRAEPFMVPPDWPRRRVPADEVWPWVRVSGDRRQPQPGDTTDTPVTGP